MAIRTILKDNDPTLRKTARPVERFDERLCILLDDMYETMKLNDGCGLAAPQVGILKRAVVMDIGEGLIEMINPVIKRTSGSERKTEGCLSIPGIRGFVSRPFRVVVKAQDRDGNTITLEGEGPLARCMCHEIDHLDGILFTDKADEIMKDEDDV